MRPIERYVRAQVPIRGSKGRVDGHIEIGLHYDDADRLAGDRLALMRHLAAQDAASAARWFGQLDEHGADRITARVDELLVVRFGDRPRFIEIWRGEGDDAEPLTQWYAPHRVPAIGGAE